MRRNLGKEISLFNLIRILDLVKELIFKCHLVLVHFHLVYFNQHLPRIIPIIPILHVDILFSFSKKKQENEIVLFYFSSTRPTGSSSTRNIITCISTHCISCDFVYHSYLIFCSNIKYPYRAFMCKEKIL